MSPGRDTNGGYVIFRYPRYEAGIVIAVINKQWSISRLKYDNDKFSNKTKTYLGCCMTLSSHTTGMGLYWWEHVLAKGRESVLFDGLLKTMLSRLTQMKKF